ncbi:hypothetical protein [Cryptosporangium sp. NPDC051539]|uniref:hypothetical protein n=1 Tax=Cryptosporangium sp. NPDC051539 TaxID=3363962 RepID=UPI00379D9899
MAPPHDPLLPVTPIRAIGIAGDETRIAPTVFGLREVAWSPRPDRSFHSGAPAATPIDPEP